jgi:hypothetical protein
MDNLNEQKSNSETINYKNNFTLNKSHKIDYKNLVSLKNIVSVSAQNIPKTDRNNLIKFNYIY